MIPFGAPKVLLPTVYVASVIKSVLSAYDRNLLVGSTVDI
jgi:hypothetical protein